MTRRHLMTLRILLMLSDGLAAALVFLGVSVLRFEGDPNAQWSVDVHPGVLALGFAVLWVGVFWLLGLYRLRARWSLAADARDVGKATLVSGAVGLSLLFVFHQDNVSRVFLAYLFAGQAIVSLASRAVLRIWFDALRRRGLNTTYTLVIGTGDLAQTFADVLEHHPSLGMKVIGHLSVPLESDPDRAGQSDAITRGTVSRPVLGTIDELHAIFHTQTVDEVAICLPAASAHYLEPVVAVAAAEGKTVRVPRDPEEGILAAALQEEFEGYLVQSLINDGKRELELAVKRVLDVTLSVGVLVLLSPLLALVAVLIRVTDGPPVIFSQVRVGRHGRRFTIYKFRTMVTDAEEQFASVASQSDTYGAAFKMREDPRVTRLGKLLRASSVDEMPQLVNVIRGEMSLVGPRPAPPREVEAYDIWHRRRLSMRPGMTGLWQIRSRMDERFDDRAELDLRYIDQWSIWRDLGILLRTVPAVLTRHGR
jgi:exopolysaccharide biosynthesis polyprenyl glycosylphosphotransferase